MDSDARELACEDCLYKFSVENVHPHWRVCSVETARMLSEGVRVATYGTEVGCSQYLAFSSYERFISLLATLHVEKRAASRYVSVLCSERHWQWSS